MAFVPADHNETFPPPKLEVLPRSRLFPLETPTPESGTLIVLALVSSVQFTISEAALFSGDAHAVVESM